MKPLTNLIVEFENGSNKKIDEFCGPSKSNFEIPMLSIYFFYGLVSTP